MVERTVQSKEKKQKWNSNLGWQGGGEYDMCRYTAMTTDNANYCARDGLL